MTESHKSKQFIFEKQKLRLVEQNNQLPLENNMTIRRSEFVHVYLVFKLIGN